MRNISKVKASLIISGIVLTMFPFNAFANDNIPSRLAGTTAEQTAVQIAVQTRWTGTAILASSTSYGMCDALAAGPLASSLKAPILLQGAEPELNRDTKAELTRLSAKTVYVTSGTAVIKQSVIDELKAMGITLVPLGGHDKYETSVNIAKQMTGVSKVAVANSIPDALSIAPIASANNEPILLTEKDVVPTSVQAYLASATGSAITASDIIGGTGVISDAVKGKFPSPTRHWGINEYASNRQVIHDFDSTLKYDHIFVANGKTAIDALAAAPLAAQTNSPIVLTDGINVPTAFAGKITTVSALDGTLDNKITVTLSTFSDSNSYVTALGGAAVVSDRISYGVPILSPSISDFKVTASGKAVTPKAISVDYATITLTVPTTDQPVAYSVSYKGGDPIVANTQATYKAPINVKIGQNFNVVTRQADYLEGIWDYVPNNDPITLIKQTGVSVAPPGYIGAGGEVVSTFLATQTGSYKVQFTNRVGLYGGESKSIYYIINVN